jgi:hypothetical protein
MKKSKTNFRLYFIKKLELNNISKYLNLKKLLVQIIKQKQSKTKSYSPKNNLLIKSKFNFLIHKARRKRNIFKDKKLFKKKKIYKKIRKKKYNYKFKFQTSAKLLRKIKKTNLPLLKKLRRLKRKKSLYSEFILNLLK